MSAIEGQPVTSDQQVAEAFGLGTALATIGSDVRHLVTGVTELKTTLGGAVGDINKLKTDSARHDEQIKTLFLWRDGVPTYATKDDFDSLRTEMIASRLTWPKLLAGVAALGGVAVGGCAVIVTIASNLGVFQR